MGGMLLEHRADMEHRGNMGNNFEDFFAHLARVVLLASPSSFLEAPLLATPLLASSSSLLASPLLATSLLAPSLPPTPPVVKRRPG